MKNWRAEEAKQESEQVGVNIGSASYTRSALPRSASESETSTCLPTPTPRFTAHRFTPHQLNVPAMRWFRL